MSAEFSGGYGSIRGQSGGNQGGKASSGGYQSEDYVIFQSLSDTISSNIFLINSNVQTLVRISKHLGSQLQEVLYDKLHLIQHGTKKLASDTTVCLKRMINLQGGSVSVRQQSTASVVENQNSMGGEEMDVDSNTTHDQNTFPQAPGVFNFTAPMAGRASSIFSAGATPGGTQGGFNFNTNTGIATTFQFGSNTSTPSGGLNFGGGVQTAGASPFMFGGASTPSSGPPNSSTTHVPFNFSANPVPLKPQQNVGQSAEQPALFSMGASQTTPSSNNRVYKKALRRSRHK